MSYQIITKMAYNAETHQIETKKMKTKTINQMETQFNRVARRFWRIESTAELTNEWTNRLARMAAALSRYRKNAYEYIWARREAGRWIGAKDDEYSVPSSIYAKQPEV